MPTPRQGYRGADGRSIPGTTTVISRYRDSGALLRWNYGQGREHEAMHWRRRAYDAGAELIPLYSPDTQIALDAFVGLFIGPDWRKEGQPPAAPESAFDTAEKAAEAGTIAHEMIERHVKGQDIEEAIPPGTDPLVVKRGRNAFKQFLSWRDSTGIRITHTEMPLRSELHRFGGTIDALGIDGTDARILVDWKTSKGVYLDHLIQLGAYATLIDENLPDLSPRGGAHLLRISRENATFSHYFYGPDVIEKAKRNFIKRRELWDLDEDLTKAMK